MVKFQFYTPTYGGESILNSGYVKSKLKPFRTNDTIDPFQFKVIDIKRFHIPSYNVKEIPIKNAGYSDNITYEKKRIGRRRWWRIE
jgi:hypothetical protein